MAKVPGFSQSPTFLVDGGGAAVTLAVRNTEWKERVRALETTDSGSGGKECWIAGIFGGTGRIEALIDAAALPNIAATGIIAGAKGVLTVPVGGATPYSVHIIIEEVGPRTPYDGLVSYDFSYKLDNTTGTYTRPT